MPPSPRLSARRINSAYFIEMIRISAHRISDTTPSTAFERDGVAVGGGPGGFFQRVEGAGADIAVTTPRAPSVAAVGRGLFGVAGGRVADVLVTGPGVDRCPNGKKKSPSKDIPRGGHLLPGSRGPDHPRAQKLRSIQSQCANKRTSPPNVPWR